MTQEPVAPNSSASWIENHWTITLLGTWLLLTLFVFLRDLHLSGPMVFPDESVYFNLARTLFDSHSFANQANYNPLYPFYLTPVFLSSSLSTAYSLARLLNALAWSAAFIPLALIALRFLPRAVPSLLIAVGCVLAPTGVTSAMIWAEPLYYPLAALSVLALLRLLEQASPARAATLGACWAALFLTKQAAMAFVASGLVAMLVHYFSSGRNRSMLKSMAIASAVCLAAISPWLIRNMGIPKAGLIGYGVYVEMILHALPSLAFLQAIGANLSTLPLAGLFILPVLFLVEVATIRSSSGVYRAFIAFSACLAVCTCLMGAGITLILAEQIGKPMVFALGRYVCVCLPYVVIIGAAGALRMFGAEFTRSRTLIWATCACAAILLLFPPIFAISAKASHDTPDLSAWAYVYFNGAFFWDFPRAVTFGDRLSLAAFPLVGVLLLCARWLRPALLTSLFAVLMAVAGVAASSYVGLLAASGAEANTIGRTLAERAIPPGSLAVDGAADPGLAAIMRFWLKGAQLEVPLRLYDPEDEAGAARRVISRKTLPLPVEQSQGTVRVYSYSPAAQAALAVSPQVAGQVRVQDIALKSFQQELTVAETAFDLSVGQLRRLQVTVKNPGPQTWHTGGKLPIRLSYVWELDGKPVPVEGNRTDLTMPLAAGQEQKMPLDVSAPPQLRGRKAQLVISLVQEQVAWFCYVQGVKAPRLSVSVK